MKIRELTLLLLLICATMSAQPLRMEDGRTEAYDFGRGAMQQFLYCKAPPLFRPDTIEICIMGDMMMHTAQISNSARYGFDDYFTEISGRISSADLAIANMEFTLAGEPYTGYPSFSAPDSFASHIAGCGFDIFLTANNHILDKGKKGCARTLDVYDRFEKTYGIRHTGCAATPAQKTENFPLIVAVKGIRIAMINFTYGTNCGPSEGWPTVYRMNDRRGLSDAIGRAEKAGADVIMALPHWGTEYKLHHSAEQEKTARWLAGEGVDVIIGAHPHVVQDYQVLEVQRNGKKADVPCIYSIGNAISNMKLKETKVGLMVHLFIERNGKGDIRMMEPEFEYLWCTLPGMKYDTHATVPIKENLDRKKDWRSPWDHDNMVSSYEMIMKETGIYEKDNQTGWN